MKHSLGEWLSAIFAFIVTMVFIVLILVWLAPKELEKQNTYIQCCSGQVCSDTYYTPKDNLCHLSLCESSILIFNKSNCTYPGRNVTVTLE